ncbi:hypothetical protein PILCRDRAFT_66408 [Piloderma croceum F 1598]|uniref:AmmeMemoRadiSam system protein B n=1 Tax=Piloderma croceum (strain F 1598) TaxID=765440 RepID=A0A0C3FMG9_PILCF|nr:hypothetical protein PILCRDRAFT_66408 [Piloderma croceum F 1598]
MDISITVTDKYPYRKAEHAGSWYTNNKSELDTQLSGWLAAVNPAAEEDFAPPIKGCKAIIAPHAGYSYSGPAAAWAYKSIDTTGIKRVFILGPSHHKSIDGCDLSPCGAYDTPLGPLPLDLDSNAKLKKYKRPDQTNYMRVDTDQAEHSIEMHLPYVRKVFEGMNIKIVPILVGAMNKEKEKEYGELLAPYLSRADTFCVVSSDFCHWGSRFDYMHYYPEPPLTNTPSVDLRYSRPSPSSFSTFPIHASISALDHEAMALLALPQTTASDAHAQFAAYLRRTTNTICGRHPIGVLLGALTALEKDGLTSTIKWVRYEQSNQCHNINDSSVSYASAYVLF